jgi:hypothetical protein
MINRMTTKLLMLISLTVALFSVQGCVVTPNPYDQSVSPAAPPQYSYALPPHELRRIARQAARETTRRPAIWAINRIKEVKRRDLMVRFRVVMERPNGNRQVRVVTINRITGRVLGVHRAN